MPDSPDSESRRSFLKKAAVATVGAVALAAGLEESGAATQAATAVSDWIDNQSQPPEFTNADLPYEIAKFTRVPVDIDFDLNHLHYREEPTLDINNIITNRRKIKYMGGQPINDDTKSLHIEHSTFIKGPLKTNPNEPDSNLWWAIPAVIEVVDTASQKIKNKSIWIYINKSNETKPYTHFYNDKPLMIDGYMDNGQVVQQKITPLTRPDVAQLATSNR